MDRSCKKVDLISNQTDKRCSRSNLNKIIIKTDLSLIKKDPLQNVTAIGLSKAKYELESRNNITSLWMDKTLLIIKQESSESFSAWRVRHQFRNEELIQMVKSTHEVIF